MTKVEEIIAQIETLTERERAMVADAVNRSLLQPEHELSDAWRKETLHRLEEIRSGKVETIPGDIVKERLQNRYRRSS